MNRSVAADGDDMITPSMAAGDPPRGQKCEEEMIIGRRRRRTTALLVTGIAAATLAACGSGDGGESSSDAELVILVHSNAPTDAVLEQINRDFEAENPGVTVRLDTVPTDQYTTTLNSRMAAGAADIVEGDTVQPMPGYIEGVPEHSFVEGVQAGNYVDLTDQEWLDRFFPDTIEDMQIEDSTWAVPTGSTVVNGIYYNIDLFDEHGIDVPRTWSEFVAAGETLQDAGVTPLLLGGSERWPVGLPNLGLIHSTYPDLAELDEALWTNPEVLLEDEAISVLEKLRALYSLAQDNFAGVSYETLPAEFAAGNAAMLPDGSWTAPVIEDAGPDFEFGYFPLPGSENPAQNVFGYKPEFVFSVPSNAENTELATQWLEFYSRPDNYAAFIEASGFLPLQPDVESTAFVAGLGDELERMTPQWETFHHGNELAGEYTPFYFEGLAPMGRFDDPDELAQRIYDDWTAGLEAAGVS
ncbi:ABC transporter substrate-binding protein [Ruania rhizosphaerae]|uniref:ABC transporter substrate-binding protein n=1 Tax=Ruania rhizosphaerae TaxID=1840413 RepID=UPI00135B4ABC|nr:extracellular solute-binding protein [Ruania rhizosphaerae]